MKIWPKTVALAHDLGHTPFGHAGEEALDAVTKDIGGFDHNAHALRLVTKLEHRYADFDGLNLTWETLEGLVKHNGPLRDPLPGPIASFDKRWPLELSTWPGLEAQLAALADDIAYVSHDIDDGLRAGLFTTHDLLDWPLVGDHAKGVLERHGELELSRFIGELIRTLMSELLEDVLLHTRANLARGQFASRRRLAGGRRCDRVLFAGLAGPAASAQGIPDAQYVPPSQGDGLDGPRPGGGDRSLRSLCCRSRFAARRLGASRAQTRCPGTVARDYIAGMTDRFALAEYARVFHTEIQL